MKVFVIDVAKCSGCYNCQIACKDEHAGNDWSPYALPQPDTGQFWCKVDEEVCGKVPHVRVNYLPRLCNHCDEAPCRAASPEAVLAVFAVLSRAGDYGAWDRNTRVVIVGEAGGFGDSLAQQVLTCALYGSVRYDDLDAALSALERGTADAVLGMIAPQDEGVSRVLGRVRNLELLSMPESLIAVRVPDEAVREHALDLGGQTAQTYALFGALCTGGAVSTEQEEAAYRAAQEAGILSVGAPGAILE